MKHRFSSRRVALLGMMTALVFASNFARITMPIAIAGRTSFTLANITCCLSGLLLGGMGGLASGFGSALYDIIGNPIYAYESWITLITKGAMGLVTGLAVQSALRESEVSHSTQKSKGLSYHRALGGAVAGCIAYYILYFAKCVFYDGVLLGGLSLTAACAVIPLKIPASLFNGTVAILAAPPLALAVRAALKRGNLLRLLEA